jgi:hypothetical protein
MHRAEVVAGFRPSSWTLVLGVAAILCTLPMNLFGPSLLFAVPMTQDPGGFLDFPWKASLEGRKDLSPAEGKGRVQEYRMTRTPLKLGSVPVSSIRLVTIDGKFARAVVRYEGSQTHQDLVTSLQRWFGPLDLTPGQLGAGSQRQEHFNWRGEETEISLTYDRDAERGVLYVDSRALASAFNDAIGGQ